ncbi:MAG: glycosyltransferase [Akkermansiaceae bacterium]|nr:glycosyltransferase [Akkermansiaceae bacterium]
MITSTDSAYDDARKASFLEKQLNSPNWQIDSAQQLRAKQCIEKIVQHRITQCVDASRVDLSRKFPRTGKRKVLLVDESIESGSVEKGLGSWVTFKHMLDAALALEDYEVFIRTDSALKKSYFQSILDASTAEKVTIVDEAANSYDLFEAIDKVFVCASHIGFEALMAGKEVHCYGVPFYAGWGMTHDHLAIPRRKQERSLEEIFHLFYIEHSRYFIPGRGVVEIENLIGYFAESSVIGQARTVAKTREASSLKPSAGEEELRILIIIPSARYGASGRYLQTLAMSLIALDCKVMVLAEGKTDLLEYGVKWTTLEFEGSRLAKSIRDVIVEFSPNIIYENGVRSRAQRAALEIMIMTGARLVMQSEDDDRQVYETDHGQEAAANMELLDKPVLSFGDIQKFLQTANLNHALHVFFDPAYDRWVEPMSRALCYRLSELHTAIWHPFAERLANEYNVPTMVVPPVIAKADFQRMPLEAEERDAILKRHGIEPHRVVIFIGGALYSYSEEYSIFLDALNLATKATHIPFALIIASKRSKLPIAQMAAERLLPEIEFADLDLGDDEVYLEVLKACDVVCSPGLPDTFNHYRLPSRLVKAMAMAKPILTCRCGFGESLENGGNAFLMDGKNSKEWAEVIAACLDREKREHVAKEGQRFAQQHFDSDSVAVALKKQFSNLLEKPARKLSDSIDLASVMASGVTSTKQRTKSHIKLRSRYASTMQDALQHLMIQGVSLKTVVHIGAGRCREMEDYCRLGAETIVLIEPLERHISYLRELESPQILVKQMAVSETGGDCHTFICRNVRDVSSRSEELYLAKPVHLLEWKPAMDVAKEQEVKTCTLAELISETALSCGNHLLVLEIQGFEQAILQTTPQEMLRKFEWIALRLSEQPIFDGGTTRSSAAALMSGLGYKHIPAPDNFAGPFIAELFSRKNDATCG